MTDDPVRAVARAAASRWPRVRVTADEFADHLRTRAAADPDLLATLRAEELFLAFACARGDEAAWRELDRHWLSKVPVWVARMSRSPAFGTEVQQRLAEKLLGGGGGTDGSEGTARLASYSGRGSLAGWLRVAAVREAQTLLRSGRESVAADEITLRSFDQDAELALLKRNAAEVFRRAFDDVVASLPDEEKSVLKLHYLDGLTLPQVAVALRMSRASVSRLIAQSRTRIIKRIDRALRDELGDDAPQPQVLAALVESQLGPSIVRQFRDGDVVD